MGVAYEVSENELPSPAISKRAWYPWVVDPVATEHVCADTTNLIEYKEYPAWERNYHGFSTAEGFYYAVGCGRVSHYNSTTVLISFTIIILWAITCSRYGGLQKASTSGWTNPKELCTTGFSQDTFLGFTDCVGDRSEIRLEQTPPVKLINEARTISPEPNIAFLMLCVLLFLHYFHLA
jgi:hypothetical protein